nr:hypothetical protein CFP56_21974 [Quercus suber]
MEEPSRLGHGLWSTLQTGKHSHLARHRCGWQTKHNDAAWAASYRSASLRCTVIGPAGIATYAHDGPPVNQDMQPESRGRVCACAVDETSDCIAAILGNESGSMDMDARSEDASGYPDLSRSGRSKAHRTGTTMAM